MAPSATNEREHARSRREAVHRKTCSWSRDSSGYIVHMHTYFSENRTVANLGKVHNRTKGTVPIEVESSGIAGSIYYGRLQNPIITSILKRGQKPGKCSRLETSRPAMCTPGDHNEQILINQIYPDIVPLGRISGCLTGRVYTPVIAHVGNFMYDGYPRIFCTYENKAWASYLRLVHVILREGQT